jgi:hypothetical protein
LIFGGRVKEKNNWVVSEGALSQDEIGNDGGLASRPDKFLEITSPRWEMEEGFKMSNDAFILDTNKWKWKKISSVRLQEQPATCHLPPATCHLPPATCHLPPATCHLPPATCHLPPATCHLPPTAAPCQ